MARRTVDLGGDRPLLDIASYGRSAPRALTPKQRQQIRLTVRRAPEVMVKVSGGATTIGGVQAHFAYIGREGDLGLEVDHGFRLVGKGFEKQLFEDWDLDLLAHRRQDERSITGTRKPPKLVHNLIFSMPPGTSGNAVLRAVRKLALNEFALKHRYALVLHTDKDHPHVHLVVKAESERGERLNIRKATLRNWREQFAANLRELGVEANATERAVRGESRTPKKDAIYRATKRGFSTRQTKEVQELPYRSAEAVRPFNQGTERLRRTRNEVFNGWHSLAHLLEKEGDFGLAERVRSFVGRMRPPATDQQQLTQKFNSRERVQDLNQMERTR